MNERRRQVSRDWQQQVDNVAAAVELDAGTAWIGVDTLYQSLKGGLDQVHADHSL